MTSPECRQIDQPKFWPKGFTQYKRHDCDRSQRFYQYASTYNESGRPVKYRGARCFDKDGTFLKNVLYLLLLNNLNGIKTVYLFIPGLSRSALQFEKGKCGLML